MARGDDDADEEPLDPTARTPVPAPSQAEVDSSEATGEVPDLLVRTLSQTYRIPCCQSCPQTPFPTLDNRRQHLICCALVQWAYYDTQHGQYAFLR